MKPLFLVPLTLCLGLMSVHAQNQEDLWTLRDDSWILSQPSTPWVRPAKGLFAEIDLPALRERLPQGSDGILEIPMPDGEMVAFRATWSPSAEADYFVRHPQTGTFRVTVDGDPGIRGRIDYTPNGFHAFIRRHGRLVMIDPVFTDRSDVVAVYYRDEFLKDGESPPPFTCEMGDAGEEVSDPEEIQAAPQVAAGRSTDVPLRTYRLAVAATGEYTTWHGGKSAASAEIITAVNRVNTVLENDMGIHLNLIASNDLIVFTDPTTDGYTNGETDVMINQNPTVISLYIPSSSYDIAHVFGVATNGQVGLAQLACVCTSSKARGVSGLFSPKFDAFYIDVVAHEMGHQFSASHSFNKCLNENPGTGWEPGSGSTIMSYAGSCGTNNVKNTADAYYHGGSLGQMKSFVRVGAGAQCGTDIPTGNQTPTVSHAYTDGFSIPISTPFILDATGSDPNGDALTWCWETMDTGPITDAGSPLLNSPLYRSFLPTTDSSRVFPKMVKVAQDIYDKFEVLPTYTRDLTFRVTLRDNNPEAGSIAQKDVAFKATDLAGPFLVTSFTTIDTVRQGDYVDITWDVANTDKSPVNCQVVSIYLSTDGGLTFPWLLAEAVPNTGSYGVTIPPVGTTAGRIMVRAADNVFFNMSKANLRILPPLAPGFTVDLHPFSQIACVPDAVDIGLETTSLLGFADEVQFSVTSGLPPGAVASFTPASAVPPASVTLSIDLSGVTQGGTFPLEILAETNGGPTAVRPAELKVFRSNFTGLDAVNPASGASGVGSSPLLAWTDQEDAQAYTLELATSPAFGATTFLTVPGLTEPEYQVLLTLDANALYFWRVWPSNVCGTPDQVPVYAFHTVTLNCSDLTNSTELTITNQGLSSVESAIDITTAGSLSEVRVQNISGSHQSIGDLRAFLVSPSGTKVKLFANQCAFIAGTINMGFNDASAQPFNCPPSLGYIYASAEPLGAMNGEPIQGTWTLIVQDLAIGGGGKINSWTLRLCTDVSLNSPVLVHKDTLFLLPSSERALSQVELLTEDPDNTASELSYTLVTGPDRGILRRQGQDLTPGSTFSQADIDQGLVTYQDLSGTTGDDTFRFTVEDGEGGWFGIETLPIRTSLSVAVRDPLTDLPRLEVFPNPAGAEAWVRWGDTGPEPDLIRLIGPTGRIVREWVPGAGDRMVRLDTSSLPAGLWTVTAWQADRSVSARLIIAR